jgi:hypothetical protein
MLLLYQAEFVYQAEFLPACLLSLRNFLVSGCGYLAGAAASVAPQSFQRIDGVVQPLNGSLGFLELSFEEGHNMEGWHKGECNATHVC